MTQCSIRDISASIRTFSVPFKRFGLFPIGTRTTAIKLDDGSLFLYASHPLDEESRMSLDSMGPVKYIVAPNLEHNISLGQYVKAYPDARVIGPAALVKKRPDIKFNGVFGKDSEPLGEALTKSGEIKAEYFDAHPNGDVAIFHPSSKTLVQADILFNLPATEQFSKSNQSATGWWPLSLLVPSFKPGYSMHKKILSLFAKKDPKSFSQSAKIVAGWDFENIIPCHGETIEGGGKEAWNSTLEEFLK